MVEIEPMDPAEELEAKLFLRQKAMHEAMDRGDSVVQQFYRGAAVFITGGSGFLGKQLIEKLFRATQISKAFILLRPKKGKSIEQRLNDILQDPVYDLLKEKQPNFAEKIVPVAGDAAELRLGLSDKDWNMIAEEVNIIYHMAATTRFDESLRVATMINVRGAREAILLGRACKQLKSYVHVSTAYSHACENFIDTEVEEDFYQSPIDPEVLITMAETVDEDRLNAISPGLIKNWPNTYSFGKAVAEETVKTMCGDLPLCIVRPAVVVCALKEPRPGWIDISNVYGASGIVVGPGLGLMHVLYSDCNKNIGLVPVDHVNNAIITAAWETAKRSGAGEREPKIYAVCSSRNPALWGGLIRTTKTVVKDNYPSPAAIAYGFAFDTSNKTMFWILSWLLHLIPGYIIDGICLILGKERRFVRLYTKMYNMSVALSYFTTNEFIFKDNNTVNLYEHLSPIDKEIFDFDITQIDWRDYMIIWCLGLRKYVVKDGLKGTAYAKKKQFVFKIIFYIIAPLYLYLLYKIVSFAVLSLFLLFRMVF